MFEKTSLTKESLSANCYLPFAALSAFISQISVISGKVVDLPLRPLR
jgi:hypothetical protein